MVNENTKYSALRIIDASFNRAMEGLRVIEEFARMHLGDSFFARQMKNERHLLANLIAEYFSDGLLEQRDILHDVGTEIQATSEYQRTDLNQILRANFARTLQSLRSIEEYSKLLNPVSSEKFERVRYNVYALEKAVVNTVNSVQGLDNARLYVLVDTRSDLGEFESLVAELIEAKVGLIQLRDKRRNDRQLVEAGRRLSQHVRGTETRWIMNDRVDLAVLCNADGVHVGQDDLDVASVRRILGPDKIVGVSTHILRQAEEAVMNGANYIGVGPVFPSQTKTFQQFADRSFIEQAVSEFSLPIFAIGGITLNNIADLIQLGIARIAVSGAVIESKQPRLVAESLNSALIDAATRILR